MSCSSVPDSAEEAVAVLRPEVLHHHVQLLLHAEQQLFLLLFFYFLVVLLQRTNFPMIV
jgi:hypothetical protein